MIRAQHLQRIAARYQAARVACRPLYLPCLQQRYFSDRLLGYSPMSPGSMPQSTSKEPAFSPIPTEQDVTTSGGVWAPTSAKRDKLNELKADLAGTNIDTLDEAATSVQKYDLWLADGLHAVVNAIDQGVTVQNPVIDEMTAWLTTSQEKMPHKDLNQAQFEEYHKEVVRETDKRIQRLPSAQASFKDIRDFVDPATINSKGSIFKSDFIDTDKAQTDLTSSSYTDVVTRLKLILLRSTAQTLSESWKQCATVASADLDRAAVRNEIVGPQVATISLAEVNKVLVNCLQGSASSRVDALWKMLDHDKDGLLEQEEMTTMTNLILKPVQLTLQSLMSDCLDARPVLADPFVDTLSTEQLGWRERRRNKKHKQRLQKMFRKTLQRHFEMEVEMAHRLRCIYAWANKHHQDNKIESVTVSEAGWSGRQRYVELPPKISLGEFREVQKVHFTHLDRVGAEYIKSFREDLWVLQGKGRQNKELMRDCMLFLVGVSIVDFAILSL